MKYLGGKDKRPRKSAAGYNLTNIMVGSEGTLGIITRATVKLHAQPEAIAAAVVNFPDIKSAVDTVVMTLQCSMPMARLELLDEVAVQACNQYSNLSLAEKPTLFLEFHSTETGLEYQTSTVNDIAKDFGGSDFDFAIKQEDRNKLWTARHKLYYAGLSMRAGIIYSLG
jgi:D-lactate dehydrogenase (cytochrome)